MNTQAIATGARERLGRHWRLPQEEEQREIRRTIFELAKLKKEPNIDIIRIRLSWACDQRLRVIDKQVWCDDELLTALCEEHQAIVEDETQAGSELALGSLVRLERCIQYIEKAKEATIDITNTIEGELAATIAAYDALALQRRIIAEDEDYNEISILDEAA